jgi:integrase/recombinase XerD
MPALLREYMSWLEVKGFSPDTRRNTEKNVGYFIVWCGERGVTRAADVLRPVLERYHRYLQADRSAKGEPRSVRGQLARLGPVCSFFRWLARYHYILTNPAADFVLPRPSKHLPREVLTPSEVDQIVALCDLETPIGLRDRAILETLYATGIRRLELTRLELRDLDAERGVLLVRDGKGRRDRYVPVGERAMAWIGKYIEEARALLRVEPDEGVLFLTAQGEPLMTKYLTMLVHTYVQRSKVGKSGSCHLFRHTMATRMLENGADIRHIQAILGHALLTSTAIYTQVAIAKLVEVHAATHPGARLTRHARDNDNENAKLDADALIAALDAEDDE